MPLADELSELEHLLADPSANALMRGFMRITPTIATVVRAPDLKVLFVSAFAADLVGKTADELQNIPFDAYAEQVKVYWPDGRPMTTDERILARAARGETLRGEEGLVQSRSGELIPVLCNAAPICNLDDEILGAIATCSDIRKQKALETELRTAYRELVHRVKNHLQIMAGLITIEGRDPEVTAAELVEHANARLKMLAAVYDGMVAAGAGERIAARPFIELVCRPYRSSTVSVEATVSPEDLTLDSGRAMPLGMLVNEAVCNSYKHAFPDGSGAVFVTLERSSPDRLVLEIADDGVGMAPERQTPTSHGLSLMRVQAEKLEAKFQIGPRPGGGTVVKAVMPFTPRDAAG